MKKFIVSVSLILAVGLTPVLAGDETGASKKAKESFEKEFVGARFVEWSREGDYLRVLLF